MHERVGVAGDIGLGGLQLGAPFEGALDESLGFRVARQLRVVSGHVALNAQKNKLKDGLVREFAHELLYHSLALARSIESLLTPATPIEHPADAQPRERRVDAVLARERRHARDPGEDLVRLPVEAAAVDVAVRRKIAV